MKKLILLIIVIFFSSCYSLKKAQKQVAKAHYRFPIATSNFCSETFPVKENIVEKTIFKKGTTIVKTDTISVDCDSVVEDKTSPNKVLIRLQKHTRTDTIFKEKIIVKENTAKIKHLELQIQSRDRTIQKKESVIAKKQNWIDILKYLLIAACIGGFLVFKLK